MNAASRVVSRWRHGLCLLVLSVTVALTATSCARECLRQHSVAVSELAKLREPKSARSERQLHEVTGGLVIENTAGQTLLIDYESDVVLTLTDGSEQRFAYPVIVEPSGEVLRITSSKRPEVTIEVRRIERARLCEH